MVPLDRAIPRRTPRCPLITPQEATAAEAIWEGSSCDSLLDRVAEGHTRVQSETVLLMIVAANGENFSHRAPAIHARDVDHHVDRQCDSLSGAAVREANVRGQDTVRKPCERLRG